VEEAVTTPVPLASLADAAHLATLAFGEHTSAVALVEAEAGNLCMPVDGPMPPDGLLRLDDILRAAVPDDARLVYATRRGGIPMATEDELALWRELVARHDGSPLVLCDWLVFVGDGAVLSLAELAGPPAPWR
jgi:hypothetical protein